MWMSVLFVLLPIMAGAGGQFPQAASANQCASVSLAFSLDAIQPHPCRSVGDVETRVLPRRLCGVSGTAETRRRLTRPPPIVAS